MFVVTSISMILLVGKQGLEDVATIPQVPCEQDRLDSVCNILTNLEIT